MDDRLTDVEVKLAYLEDHVEQLDGLIRQLYDVVERQQRWIAEIAATDGLTDKGSDAETEKPPHY